MEDEINKIQTPNKDLIISKEKEFNSDNHY